MGRTCKMVRLSFFRPFWFPFARKEENIVLTVLYININNKKRQQIKEKVEWCTL